MTTRVLVPIADGTEELEAVAVIDVLRRAGVEVVVAAVGERREVTCARGVRLVADALLRDVAAADFALVALPGGAEGARRLRDSQPLVGLLRRHHDAGGRLAAICAAPAVVLAAHDLLGGRRATAHPSVFDRLPADRRVTERVVVDGQLVTSRGAGTAVEFALTLVELLQGPERRREVAAAMVADPGPA